MKQTEDSNRLDWRRRIEWGRKAVHSGSALLAIWVLNTAEPLSTVVLAIAACGMILVDLARLALHGWALWFYRTFPFIFRRDERRTLSGAAVMMIGIALTSFFFSGRSAAVGILCLAWGDASAAIAGQAFSLRRQQLGHEVPALAVEPIVKQRGRKTLAGSAACFLVSTLATGMLIDWNPWLSLVSGFAAAVMERWTPGHWDNLSIPLVAAAVVEIGGTWS